MRYKETKGVLFELRQELAALVAKADALVDEVIESPEDKFEDKVQELNAARIAVARKQNELRAVENTAYNLKKIRRP